ncbi:UNVERIFIED_CONTAM: Retrovirus-related Pol polyprotein from transposon TNT 1-94 [Sesamum angustifolium]|uniref:Retrovirus-related Pol polyprotein from transposon TNT 1-94 n=1 Tax=Sesamum angustifolium TaxID=2727405 RepID=A0AAW2LWP0_9LAMI
MTPPEGLQVPAGHVCKLVRSLYSLKHASREWNHEFTIKFELFGFLQSKHDHYLFIKDDHATFTILLVYVDDILVVGNSKAMILDVKKYLDSLFTIKDLGIAKYFLGLEIARSLQGIAVTQTKYISDILQDVGSSSQDSHNTPASRNKFSAEAGNALPNPAPYRRLIGRLIYLGFTRPDIAHATQQLSQYLQHPCKEHWMQPNMS